MTNLDIPALVVATAISLLCRLWLPLKLPKPKFVGKAVTLDELANRIARDDAEGGLHCDEIMQILSGALEAKEKKERAEP